jgi:hypothetical protein
MLMHRILPIAIAALLATSAVWAQNAPQRNRLTGTIAAVQAESFTVKAEDGKTYTVALTPASRIVADEPQSIDGIILGSYIATDLVKDDKGRWRATIGHTQPEPFGNNALWFRPIPGKPDAMRLLGIVKDMMPGGTGMLLLVAYDKGDMTIEIPATITLYNVRFDGPGLLKPGLAVDLSYDRAADGTLAGRFVTVERDGFKPVAD